MSIIGLLVRHSVLRSADGFSDLKTEKFNRALARWREKSLRDGVELAEEAERRVLLGGPHLDLSRLGLMHLPEDVALPAAVRLLDLSGNPLLNDLPLFFFSQSEELNVNIEDTSVAIEAVELIQSQVKGIHFITSESGYGQAIQKADLETTMNRFGKRLAQNDTLNHILSEGRDIHRRACEINRTRSKHWEVHSGPFSLKTSKKGIMSGLLLMAGNVKTCQDPYALPQSNEHETGMTLFQVDESKISQDEGVRFSKRRLLMANDDINLVKTFRRLENMKKILTETPGDAVPPSLVLDMLKVVKPGFLQKIGGVVGGMSRRVPLSEVQGSDYSNATKVDRIPILDGGVIEDDEIPSFVNLVIDHLANEAGYIKGRIIEIWTNDRAVRNFEKLFGVIKTMNAEVGEERAWKKSRNELENIIYQLKNNGDREEYAKYEFGYMASLISRAIKNVQHESMDIFGYLSQWIIGKVKQFESQTGNKTFYTPDSTFNLKNAFTKAPQLIHGRLYSDSAGHTVTYKTFTLAEIALGFPFNQQAAKHTTHWVGEGANYTRFMHEQEQNAPFFEFLYAQDFQRDITEAFRVHMRKPEIQSDIKTISEKMIILRCITFLSLPTKERSPELVVAVRGFLEGKVYAKRLYYKGTALNGVFMIPTEEDGGVVLTTDDAHFYFIENKKFKTHPIPNSTLRMIKIIKNEVGLDNWILRKLPQYQRLEANNIFEPVTIYTLPNSSLKISGPGVFVWKNYFVVNIKFEGDYTLDTLVHSFLDSYVTTYPEDIDTLITTPSEHTSAFKKLLAIEIIGDMSSLLVAFMPLSGILNRSVANVLMKGVPLALSASEVGLVGSLINESEHPDDKRNYGNEMILSLVGLGLDLPDGVRLAKKITKKTLNTLLIQYRRQVQRGSVLTDRYIPLTTSGSFHRDLSVGPSTVHKNKGELPLSHDIKERQRVGLLGENGVEQHQLKTYDDRDILEIQNDHNAEKKAGTVVVDAYSEDDIYLEMIKLRHERSPESSISSVGYRLDLQNSPSSKEVSRWWREKDQRDLNDLGITSSDSLAKAMFNDNEIPDEYDAFFYNIKRIENRSHQTSTALNTKLDLFDEMEGCVRRLFNNNVSKGGINLPKYEQQVLTLYLSEMRYQKKAIRTRFELQEAFRLKRTQNKAINIATAKVEFPHINAYDRRFHKLLYEKMLGGDFAKALRNIQILSKEGCLNAIIEICKHYKMKLEFIRLHLYSKNKRLTQYDIPRIFIGDKTFALYPLGLKKGLIGMDDLDQFGKGAVLINGNVSLMEESVMKKIIQKKYYSYDIEFGYFSDESKLLTLYDGNNKWVPTATFHQPSAQAGIVSSTPIGIDFNDPKFNSIANNRQGVFEMSELGHRAVRRLPQNDFKKIIKMKFYSQVDEQIQPMSIGVPTTALPPSMERYLGRREGGVLNRQEAKLWNDAALVFKDELNTLGVDIIICVDSSMTRTYYNRRHLLSERFRRILAKRDNNLQKKIKYIHRSVFALPNRITSHNVAEKALITLSAAVNKIERLMKASGKKIAIQSSIMNESSALVRAGLMIKRNLTEKKRDQLSIFKRVHTPSGNINAPIIVELAVSYVRMSDSSAFSDTKHIELLTRYAFKLVFETRLPK